MADQSSLPSTRFPAFMHGLAPCVVREELIVEVADRPAVLQWLRASNKPVVVVVMGQELVISSWDQSYNCLVSV